MILISAQDVQKSFGTHEVLKGVSFSLQKGEKMGLVGVNGCGKTTLMRIISGEAEADGGMVHKNRDLRIGYLRQVDDIALTDTVWEALLRVFEPVIAMERRLRELEAQMEQNADPQTALRLTGEYQRLLDRYNEAEGYAYEGEMLGVLNGLGLKPDMHGGRWAPSPAASARGFRWPSCFCKSPTSSSWTSPPTIWTWRPSNGCRAT